MDDASSTYVKLCLIICSVFYLILLGSNIETNMVDVCECSMHFCGTFETDKTKWHNRNNLVFISLYWRVVNLLPCGKYFHNDI